MVLIAVPVEGEAETRAAVSPETVKKYIALGCQVQVQAGVGLASSILDADYEEMGAKICNSLAETFAGADIVLKVQRPSREELAAMDKGTIVCAMLNPFDDKDGIEAMASAGIKSFAMELMPRISRAQSMDVLSSQSNLAGYKAVIDSAAHFGQAMPMMMTAAGTVPPAKVFVMGAGVAGLQAVATAKRLGAIVTATDVRPAAKEQVESLGGKFIAVENDEFKEAETAGGYAKEMSDEYKREQAELVAKHVQGQNIVITTALIPGRPAPKLISADMVHSMKAGSIIYDMAVERGGNCELARPGEIVNENGVLVMGPLNIAGALAGNATSLYAKNLFNFIGLFVSEEDGIKIDFDDEIIQGTLVSNDGKIVHATVNGRDKLMNINMTSSLRKFQLGTAVLVSALLPASHAFAASSGDQVSSFTYLFALFVLAIFVGYFVVWAVTPALHTPLMAVTNAISSVIVVGALLAVAVPSVDGLGYANIFGFLALVMAAVNIFGGFLVTQRMLAMYKKKER